MAHSVLIIMAAIVALLAVLYVTLFYSLIQTPVASVKSSKPSDRCYLAAVYEHQRIGDTNLPYNATWVADQNLHVYERVAELASKKGAAIIVFPESSLYKSYHGNLSREIVNSVAEEIPSPSKQLLINPCLEENRYKHKSPKITRLSCLAKLHNIYIVCNLGEKQPCSSDDEFSSCPKDGHYNFNTDVIFDNQGNLLARYRKFSTFNEELFHDRPKTPERVVIDTPFGKLGVFTCFDLVFDRPALEVVLKDEVQTVLYPTRWYDEMPFFPAIQAQAAWSYTMNVNVLAANGHLPSLGTIGSGIYSGRRGPIIYKGVKLDVDSNGRGSGSGSSLILANIPVDPNSWDVVCDTSLDTVIDVSQYFDIHNDKKFKQSTAPTASLAYNHMNMEYIKDDQEVILLDNQGDKTLCVGEFCCRVIYKLSESDGIEKQHGKDLIIFTRNHVRPGKYNWYEQSCLVATIEKSAELVGKRKIFSNTSPFVFDNLRLEANFNTRFVFEASANNVSTLVLMQKKDFKCSLTVGMNPDRSANATKEENLCSLHIKDNEPLTNAGLYGRLYERDEL